MSKSLICREKEVDVLEKAMKTKEAQLIAVYGRRRIGKTHLIREFYSDKGLYLQFTGVQDASSTEQLANFHDELSSVFTQWIHSKPPANWREAFQRLTAEDLITLDARRQVRVSSATMQEIVEIFEAIRVNDIYASKKSSQKPIG